MVFERVSAATHPQAGTRQASVKCIKFSAVRVQLRSLANGVY